MDDGHILVYAPLKRVAFVANRAMVNAVAGRCESGASDYDSEYIRLLERIGFFQPEPLPSDDIKADHLPQYDTVILFPTNQCNLRCSYCYASSGDHPPRQMTWDAARAAIDHVAREVLARGGSEITLGFHGGGEPSLNRAVIEKSVARIRSLAEEHSLDCTICGAFNGYWSAGTLDFIIEHFTDLSLSFDGTPGVQRRQRPTAQGGDAGRVIERTLHALDRAEFPYGIRMTVTHDSVDDLAHGVRFICENFHPRKIQAEPVFSLGRAEDHYPAGIDPGRFVDRFLEALDIARDHGVELFYSGAGIDNLSNRFCLAAARALVVTTEGDVTTCFEVYGREHPESGRFLIGRYNGNGGFDIDMSKARQHAARTVEEIDYCRDCFCKWTCAGDCRVKTAGNPNRPGERCALNRELTQYLLLDRIKNSGGFLWNGGGATQPYLEAES